MRETSTNELPLFEDEATDTGTPAPAPPRARGFAGFRWSQIMLGIGLVGALVWGAWTTRELLHLKDRRVVSVSLAAMANDFIMAEARSGASPEQVEADTRHYMAGLQAILQKRSEAGETIIVSEAIVAGSAMDITPEVRAAVGDFIKRNPPPKIPVAIGATGPIMPNGAIGPSPGAPLLPSAGLLPGAGN